jgi:type VI secretion system ImpH/TssG family protein
MASTRRPSSDHLNFLRRSVERARRFSIFALLRQAEARAPDLPLIGRSRVPGDNIADLAHSTTLDFPGPTVEAVEFGATGRARVRTYFLGLTGPMGALPLHLSELVHYERRYAKSQPIGRFFDLLTDRMLQFFYRAWADTQPAASIDRPGDDRFSFYVSSLAGIREDQRTRFPPAARLGFANLFVSRRNPAALVDALSHLLGVRTSIQEFIGRWRDIVPADRTRIGARGNCNGLGRSAVLGRRVRVIEDTYRIRLHASEMAEYRRHIPGTERFFAIQDVLDTLAPPHLEWQLQLELDESAIEPARLDGAAPLGWAAWVAPGGAPRVRGDARLGRKPHSAGHPA